MSVCDLQCSKQLGQCLFGTIHMQFWGKSYASPLPEGWQLLLREILDPPLYIVQIPVSMSAGFVG